MCYVLAFGLWLNAALGQVAVRNFRSESVEHSAVPTYKLLRRASKLTWLVSEAHGLGIFEESAIEA